MSDRINLNGCVERWCSRVLLTECKAVGAKIVITNGEEYESMDGAEDIFCCVVCFPVWLIQTGIYKLHRKVVYDDYAISFDADDMFLHGTAQDVTCQRQYIFKGPETQIDVSVFRTRCTDQTDKQRLQELGTFKFMAVKRFDKYDAEATITEHETTTFGELVNKRKDKIIANDAKLKAKHLLGNHHNDKDLGRTKSEENVYASDSTKDISRANTIIFTNEGFDNDSESDVESDTAPAIPELPSDEINASTNTQIHTEQVSKPKFALDTMFTAKSVKSRTDGTSEGSKRTIENKSLTAVCSFELQDSVVMVDSETYRYDSLHDNKIGLTTTSTFENVGTKESVLDEIKKLDSSLPNVEHAKPRSTENDGVSSEETSDDKNKKVKSQKKKHKRKIIKDIKELTKTTYAAAPGKPSEMDIRYQKARVRLSKNKTKTSSNVKAEINQTHEILRGSIEEVRAKNDEQQRDASGQEDTISVCDDTVSDFKVVESSSDGEEVEMIYQSERQTDRGNVKPVQESAIDTLIDEVKKVNTESLISRKDDNSFDQQNDFNSEDEFKMSDSENEVKPVEFNLYASKEPHIVDVRASSVEHDIDVTDLDEAVVTQSNPFNDVPKLRLNTRDSLDKKVKRGSKNTSIRKYLGLNPPLRNKRH
ncbi:uncharacterized protein LOC127877175 [Dreissena polymorpha]|uniref:uncharacterized protein LOC127877175 n=1 Tax=Dreissena polymorpha TaxID=45954 RepID=UPI002263DE1A|nr:uncharacterized protein LOC127877175 [Dreissena polymorpha]